MRFPLGLVCLMCSLTAWGQQQRGSALEDLIRAAEQGNAISQYNLALKYDFGRGVPQDYAEAVKWYRLSAEQGRAQAPYNLGLMHYHGRGVPPSSPVSV